MRIQDLGWLPLHQKITQVGIPAVHTFDRLVFVAMHWPDGYAAKPAVTHFQAVYLPWIERVRVLASVRSFYV